MADDSVVPLTSDDLVILGDIRDEMDEAFKDQPADSVVIW